MANAATDLDAVMNRMGIGNPLGVQSVFDMQFNSKPLHFDMHDRLAPHTDEKVYLDTASLKLPSELQKKFEATQRQAVQLRCHSGCGADRHGSVATDTAKSGQQLYSMIKSKQVHIETRPPPFVGVLSSAIHMSTHQVNSGVTSIEPHKAFKGSDGHLYELRSVVVLNSSSSGSASLRVLKSRKDERVHVHFNRGAAPTTISEGKNNISDPIVYLGLPPSCCPYNRDWVGYDVFDEIQAHLKCHIVTDQNSNKEVIGQVDVVPDVSGFVPTVLGAEFLRQSVKDRTESWKVKNTEWESGIPTSSELSSASAVYSKDSTRPQSLSPVYSVSHDHSIIQVVGNAEDMRNAHVQRIYGHLGLNLDLLTAKDTLEIHLIPATPGSTATATIAFLYQPVHIQRTEGLRIAPHIRVGRKFVQSDSEHSVAELSDHIDDLKQKGKAKLGDIMKELHSLKAQLAGLTSRDDMLATTNEICKQFSEEAALQVARALSAEIKLERAARQELSDRVLRQSGPVLNPLSEQRLLQQQKEFLELEQPPAKNLLSMEALLMDVPRSAAPVEPSSQLPDLQHLMLPVAAEPEETTEAEPTDDLPAPVQDLVQTVSAVAALPVLLPLDLLIAKPTAEPSLSADFLPLPSAVTTSEQSSAPTKTSIDILELMSNDDEDQPTETQGQSSLSPFQMLENPGLDELTM